MKGTLKLFDPRNLVCDINYIITLKSYAWLHEDYDTAIIHFQKVVMELPQKNFICQQEQTSQKHLTEIKSQEDIKKVIVNSPPETTDL